MIGIPKLFLNARSEQFFSSRWSKRIQPDGVSFCLVHDNITKPPLTAHQIEGKQPPTVDTIISTQIAATIRY